jgi:hypothetical protein
MKALVFSRIYKKDKYIVIYNSPAIITSRYFTGDLQSTLHQLEKALMDYDKCNNNHFGNEKIERFLKWFGELGIKTNEAQEDAAKEVERLDTIHYRWNIRSSIVFHYRDISACEETRSDHMLRDLDLSPKSEPPLTEQEQQYVQAAKDGRKEMQRQLKNQNQILKDGLVGKPDKVYIKDLMWRWFPYYIFMS